MTIVNANFSSNSGVDSTPLIFQSGVVEGGPTVIRLNCVPFHKASAFGHEASVNT
jgi:hypothetical protein